MDELYNESVETQEVAAPAEEPIQDTPQEYETRENAESEVVNPNTVQSQSQEDNAKFATLRRQMEDAQQRFRTSAEKEQQLLDSLKLFGVEVSSIDDVADLFRAQASEKTVEEVRAERQWQEQQQSIQAQKDEQLDYYRSIAIHAKAQDDLSRLQKLDSKVKDINELGDDFIKLLASGVSVDVAYHATQAIKKPVPKDMGKLNSTPADKEFYTSAEVDKLTPEQMNDPKIRNAVRNSMSKWR